jgi:tetratricopeptide (TPR) repeat protein
MRLAVLVGPQSHASSEGRSSSSALGDLLRNGGYEVAHVPLGGELEPALTSALAPAGPGDSVLVYLAGITDLADAKLAFRMAGGDAPPFELASLGTLVAGRGATESLFVLDVALDEPDVDALRAAEYVEAAIDGLEAKQRGFGMLVAAAGGGPASGPYGEWVFTRLFVDALDDPGTRDETGAIYASRVYAHLRANGALTERVPSFAHVKGKKEFLLLPAAASKRSAPMPAAALAEPRSVPPGSIPPAAEVRSNPPGPISPPNASRSAPPESIPPSAMPRSVPPGSLPPSAPPLAVLLEKAAAAFDAGELDLAYTEYKKALMIAAPDARRAAIYMRLGEIKKRQGKPREAELNFEKALGVDTNDRKAHEALVRLAEEAGDVRRVLALRKRMREALSDPAELPRIADTLESLKDTRGAVAVLEEARSLLPGDAGVLGRLRRLYEAGERWRKLLEVTGELAAVCEDRAERAKLRFAQADIALGRLLDEERGVPWLEQALEDDPTHEKALAALVAIRSRRKEHALLDKAYAKLVDRFAAAGDEDRAWNACTKLGLLRRDSLRDVDGAIDAFRGALRCRPSDVESQAALADLLMTKADFGGALAELVAMAEKEPLRFATYRKLYDLHTRAGRTDRAWLAGTALEELKAADMDHQLFVDQYRAHHTQVVRPAAVFDEKHWRECIRARGADEDVAAILRAVSRAAAQLRVTTLKKEKRLFSLSPERRQSKESTVSIVRTFVWASQVLDVPLPELYVYDDVPGGLAAVQGDARATAIGPAVLSGMPLSELAFVVARHLTYYRPEHYALVFYPTLPELLSLFLSAVEVGLPEMAVSSRQGTSGKQLVLGLRKTLTDGEKDELGRAAARFEEGGGRVDLAAWIRGVELTATRAGLVLAGDLAVAMRVLRRETRSIADVSVDDKRTDLLAYSASEQFAKLRDELSITAEANAAAPSSTR